MTKCIQKDNMSFYMFFYAVPLWIAVLCGVVAIIGMAIIELLISNTAVLKIIEIFVLSVTFVFVIYVTIIHRNVGENGNNCLIPFYSFYMAKQEVEVYRLILLNILMFLPFGIVLPFILNHFKQNVLFSIVFGISLSLCIEIIQLVFRIGTFEIDDIIFNTFGCLIGLLSFSLFKVINNKVLEK